MPTITIAVNLDRVLDSAGSPDLSGVQWLTTSYAQLQVGTSPARVLTRTAVEWTLTDGVGEFKCEPTPTGNGIIVQTHYFRWCVAVGAGDDGKDLTELTLLDESTLDPVADPEPAWWAAAEQWIYAIPDPADPDALVLRFPVQLTDPGDDLIVNIPILEGA